MRKLSSNDKQKKKIRRRNKIILLLFLLFACSIGGLIGIASLRYPVAPTTGNFINAQGDWKTNKVKSFRVSTYNICRGKGLDGVRNIARTASVLRNNDIVGVNEVAGASIFGTPNQAQQLGKLLNMGWLFAPNQTRWFTPYFGNALLSRFNVEEWFCTQLVWSVKLRRHELKSHSNRNLISARYKLDGHNVYVLITHLDRGTIQPAQLHYVLSKFLQHKYAILMGDFNTSIANPQLIKLFKDPSNVNAIKVALGRSDNNRRVDWIITRGFKVLGGGEHPVGISDHPNYWVELSF